MFKESYYTGTSKRRTGTPLLKKDSSIPKRYDQISVTVGSSRHTYLVCNRIIKDNIMCDFCVRRDSYIKEHEKFDNHKCMSLQIERFFNQKAHTEELTIEQLTAKIIEFFGQNKLSLNIISSDTFKEMCLALIKKGQANPLQDPATLLSLTSRTTFTKCFIQYSKELFNQQLEAFKRAKGTTLTIDAGKHKVTPYLIAVIANAMLERPPLIIDCIPFFKGKRADYATAVEKIVTDLISRNIDVVAIVSDNLRTQVSAINHASPDSFQQNSTIPEVSKIIWLSCSCHTLALGLCDAAKQSIYGDLAEDIVAVSTFLRRKNIANLLGLKCPMTCPTRWTGLYDLSLWIIRNIERITSKILESLEKDVAYDFPEKIIHGLYDVAPIIFCLLQPFAIATHMLEADHMPAAYTIPVINRAIQQCKENAAILDINHEMVMTMIMSIENRIMNSQSGRILQLLYSLTPEGRSELRSVEGLDIHGIDAYTINDICLLPGSPTEQELINNIKESPDFLTNKGKELCEAFSSYHGHLLNSTNGRKLVCHEGADDEEEDYNEREAEPVELNFIAPVSSINAENEEEDHDSFDDEEDYDDTLHEEDMSTTTNGPLADKITTLKEIAEIQGYSAADIAEIVNSYIDWITGDPDTFLIHQEPLMKGIHCWTYYSSMKSMKKFATFVLPLMGIISSEASCERAFWQQKRILGDQSTKTSTEVEKAKLFFAVKH